MAGYAFFLGSACLVTAYTRGHGKDGLGFRYGFGLADIAVSAPHKKRAAITSHGSDGVADGGGLGVTTDFDCDILFSNGQFIKWPEGIQT